MKQSDAIFSSKNDEWETPQAIFDELDKEFHFTLDPCSTHKNHKCPQYFTKEEDGLSQKWGGGGILQPTIFASFQVGGEVPRRVQDRWNHDRAADTSQDRHKVLSRLHLSADGDPVHQRKTSLRNRRRGQEQFSVSKHGCDLPGSESKSVDKKGDTW